MAFTLKLKKSKAYNPSTKEHGYRTTVKDNGRFGVDALVETASKNTTMHKAEVRMALELIATLRRLRGLTQEQLAQEAGLQRTHVNRIEAGKYAVTIDVVQAIAQVLGMTVDLIDPALQDLAPLRKLNTDK